MDPTACLRSLSAAMRATDFDVAKSLADDLGQWLRNGGFPPDGWMRWDAASLVGAVAGAKSMPAAIRGWNEGVAERRERLSGEALAGVAA